jgi:hypothetical protein
VCEGFGGCDANGGGGSHACFGRLVDGHAHG